MNTNILLVYDQRNKVFFEELVNLFSLQKYDVIDHPRHEEDQHPITFGTNSVQPDIIISDHSQDNYLENSYLYEQKQVSNSKLVIVAKLSDSEKAKLYSESKVDAILGDTRKPSSVVKVVEQKFKEVFQRH